jgi:hypothetical protein
MITLLVASSFKADPIRSPRKPNHNYVEVLKFVRVKLSFTQRNGEGKQIRWDTFRSNKHKLLGERVAGKREEKTLSIV